MRWLPVTEPKKSISKRVDSLSPPSRIVSVPKLMRVCFACASKSAPSSTPPIGVDPVRRNRGRRCSRRSRRRACRSTGRRPWRNPSAGSWCPGAAFGVIVPAWIGLASRLRRCRGCGSRGGRRGRRPLLGDQLLHDLLEFGDARSSSCSLAVCAPAMEEAPSRARPSAAATHGAEAGRTTAGRLTEVMDRSP